MTDPFSTWSPEARDFGHRLRQLIHEMAKETRTGPLTETLKWGQPAYLTEATRAGTTIRSGDATDTAPPGRLYVHCGTNLVERYRTLFDEHLMFEGKRAICLPLDLTPEAPIRACIGMALTYHRDKTGQAA